MKRPMTVLHDETSARRLAPAALEREVPEGCARCASVEGGGSACHRRGSGGPIETPVLAEQQEGYIVAQLKMYASGERRNDVYGRMRAIAAKLKDSEIKELSAYYRAGLR